MKSNLCYAILPLAISVSCGPVAFAKSSAPAIEEITVTAQYREQSLQEVPASITAFSSTDITDAGITSSQDFVNQVPNLSLDDSFTYGNTFVVIRGLTQVNNADSPVAIVVDGVPQNNQKQFKMELFDIERIEVLKGPQGALYGRNAIGGAINIVTKQPTNTFTGKISGTLESGLGEKIVGVVSGPITKDKVLFRLGGSYYQTNGLIRNVYLGDKMDFVDHDYSLRGKVTVNASDNVTLDLRAAYRNYQAGSSYDVPVRFNPDLSVRNGDANTVFAPNNNLVGLTNGDSLELSAKLDIATQLGTLTSITGYTDLTESYRADIDFSNKTFDPTFAGFAGLWNFLGSVGAFTAPAGAIGAGQGQDLSVKMTSQEVRLVSPGDKRFRYILGGYFLHTDRDLQTRLFADLNGRRSQINDPSLIFVNTPESNSNNAWSVFGQLEYDITDALNVQGGIRYDSDSRNQTDLSSGLKRHNRFSSVQPKITLNYHFNSAVMGYATYSTGFRSGGFNAPIVTFPEFGDETLDNYEVGLKSSLMDGRLVLNSALYRADDHGFQFFFLDLATGQQIIQNLKKVGIWGFDVDFKAALSDQISVFGGVGYTDTKIKEIGSSALEAGLMAAGVDISNVIGSKTPKSTPWSANLGIQGEFPVSGAMKLVLRGDYEFRGKKYWQIDNQDVQRALHLLSARATLTNDIWAITAFADNITNERYYTDFNPGEFLGLSIDLGYPSRPRVFGVEASYRF